ncbi:MAG: Ppx/GppA family phosphatase [Pseudomonadota bacterium]
MSAEPSPRRGPLSESQEAAVIDVGSNSVRLVVYRIDGRAMTPILNEKVMAGLGRDLNRTGALSKEGIDTALRALKRFAALIDGLGVDDVFAVGTAAVRVAKDGREFAARVMHETGIDLRILDGSEEARLSALGAITGAPGATGVVGDLGGASLELIEIGPDGPGRGETFPLGPFTLARDEPFDADRIAAEVTMALVRAETLKNKGGDFYAVGGAWRALGRIDIAQRNHPIGVLDHHEIGRTDVLRLAELVRKQSKKSLEKLEEAAAKRAETLPYASVVLERVMMVGGFDRVILSAFGLREGVLLERMSAKALAAHPLIAAAEALAGRADRARAFGRALEAWMTPMFAGQPAVFTPERDKVLRGAAARLADLGGPLHPDQRVEVMFDLILRAPLAAIGHAERAFLAAAIHHRYTKAPPRHADAYLRLLNEDQQRAAAALGAALRLGADLSGRSEVLLRGLEIEGGQGKLVLKAPKRLAHLLTEQTAKRLDAAASALGLVGETRIG